MEIYNRHVAVSLISDLLSEIENKVYFFFKGDRSFDYCSRSYFWILLAVYITLESKTVRKHWFLLDKKHLGTKRKKKSSCARFPVVYPRFSGGVNPKGGVGNILFWPIFTKTAYNLKHYRQLLEQLWIFEWGYCKQILIRADYDGTFTSRDTKIDSQFYTWG